MNSLSEKLMIPDSIMTLELLTIQYSSFFSHCNQQQIRNDIVNILSDLHKMLSDMGDEYVKRGWQKVQNVPQELIQQIIDKSKEK